MRRGILWVCAAAAWLSLASCASAPERVNVSATLREARVAFQNAKDHGAREKAPYHYYSAELYLSHAAQLLALGRTDEAAFVATRALNLAREAEYYAEIFAPAREGP